MDEENMKTEGEAPLEGEASPTAGDAIAQELLPVSLETEMRRSYLDYAMSVIVGRALPDVRDGLKPVHRRVLFAMKEIGNTHNNPTKKSARVVGEVLGKYHPHGDIAAYQTIVRMAQDFSMRYPLIQGQGNFGSIDGDNAAAMRYTEVRLMKIASEMLADLNEETVDFVPNFDNSEQEPVVLPTRLPELLVNGSSGIAVGMATNIPPHNLKETIDACLHALEHPDCTIDELIQRMPAPDFPTGGIIFGMSGIHQGYRTGRGRVLMRARTHLEDFGKGRVRIVVDEIPYMVNKRVLYERMHELVREKKIEGVAEMRDESSDEIRIAIDLKQGAMPEVVLNNLYKLTQMQESFGINMVALVDGQPMLLTLKQMIEYFLAHRREVVTRRTVFRLRKAREAGHLLEGQAVALANLDEFIRLIRAAKTVDEAVEALYGRGWDMGFAREITERAAGSAEDLYPDERGLRADGLYYLTRSQVDNILAMNLRRLTGLEREKVKTDYEETVRRILDLIDILAKPARVSAIIGEELKAIREEFGDERRSSIDLLGDPNFDKRDLIPRRDMVVTITRAGFVKSQDIADYQAQARGGKGRNVQATTKDDEIEQLLVANTHDILLCFSTAGRVYPIDVFDLPEGKASARGRPVVNLLPLEENERLTFILPIQGFDDEHYVFMTTDTGTVKKVPLTAFQNIRTKGIIATQLEEGESLAGVAITDGTHDIMLFSDAGKSVRFAESDVRPMGRSARGVRGMRLKDGQRVIALAVVDDETKFVLTATEHGYGKRTRVTEYGRQGRGGQGIISIATSERNGRVVAASLVTDEDDIMLLSTGGKVVRTHASEVSVIGRATQGVRLINMGDDTLASVRSVIRGGDEVEHLQIEVPEGADVPALEEEEPEAFDENLEDDVDDFGDDLEEDAKGEANEKDDAKGV